MSIATALTALNADVDAAKAAIENKGGTAPNGTADMADAIAAIPSGGITPSGNINITDTNVTDVTSYATATVVSENLTAENIKKNVNILGVLGEFEGGGSLPTSISMIDGGSFTLSSDTAGSAYNVSHNLGVAPKGYIAWAEQYDWDSPGSQSEFKLGCVFACAGSGSNEGFSAALRNPKGSTDSVTYNALVTDIGSYLTSATCKLPFSAISYKASTTYNWLAWA